MKTYIFKNWERNILQQSCQAAKFVVQIIIILEYFVVFCLNYGISSILYRRFLSVPEQAYEFQFNENQILTKLADRQNRTLRLC